MQEIIQLFVIELVCFYNLSFRKIFVRWIRRIVLAFILFLKEIIHYI